METTPKKARRCQLTDRGNSMKCVTSKQNKEESLIQRGRWKRRCRWRSSVWCHLRCCWCPDGRVWQSVRSSLLPLCVPQTPFCPLVDLWRSRHLQAFRNRGVIFFFWPVKYEWGSLSGDNSWPKDSAGNEHTAAWRRWTGPFLRATSVTVASGFTNLEKRYYQSTVRWPFEAVRTSREGRRGWKINIGAPMCPAKYSGVSHVLIFIVIFRGAIWNRAIKARRSSFWLNCHISDWKVSHYLRTNDHLYRTVIVGSCFWDFLAPFSVTSNVDLLPTPVASVCWAVAFLP